MTRRRVFELYLCASVIHASKRGHTSGGCVKTACAPASICTISLAVSAEHTMLLLLPPKRSVRLPMTSCARLLFKP